MRKFNFQEWYDIYQSEIDTIINHYIEFIMSEFAHENMTHSLNLESFKKQMKKLIYQTSYNTEKSILYL